MINRPERKHPRLKTYDYSLPGYYYVTIHTEKGTPLLSSVGRGLAPAEATLRLLPLGRIIQQQLRALERRFRYVTIDKYVIMPNHIHAIIRLMPPMQGDTDYPTLMDVVCAFKSIATRVANQHDGTPGRKIFQTSFYEKVLRNERMYQECWRYIEGNPSKWLSNEENGAENQ